MAIIPKNLGQAGSAVNSDRGSATDLRSILLSILEDLTNLRQAAVDIDAGAGTTVTIAELVTKSE